MMTKKHRLVALAVCLFLAVSLLPGCGGQTKTSDTSASPAGQPTANAAPPASSGPEPLTMPITKDKLTLTFFIEKDAAKTSNLKSYGEIAAFKELEKRSGITVEFQHPPAGQATEQFNLMIASQSLTDIIYYNWQTIPGGPAKAIDDKSIIKLNDAMGKYTPNFKKVLAANPEADKQAKLDDGSYYMFPMLWLDPVVRIWYGPQVRKDWLDKLGLKSPATIDEWYTVLKAFKEKDPNGNGKNDEIPFAATKNGEFKYFIGAWGMVDGFYQADGKVKHAFLEPQYKDYLTTMAKWYKEGLIDPEYASADGKNFDAKVTGDVAGAYNGSLVGNMGRYINTVTPKNPKFQLAGTEWPTGPAGKAYISHDSYIKSVPGHGAAISAGSKYVKEAVKLIDYIYSDEGNRLFSYGIEGESYTMKNGKPEPTEKVMKNTEGLSLDQSIARYALPNCPIPIARNAEAFKKFALSMPSQQDAVNIWTKADTSLLLPPLTPTQAESARFANVMNEVNTYLSEMTTKMVMGVEPVENMEKHVKAVKGMGIEEALKIMQASLDRYKARK